MFYHEVPLDPRLHSKYAMANANERRLLAACQPYKVALVQQLVTEAVNKGRKVLVFCDELMPLRVYAETLGVPSLCGETCNSTRDRIIEDYNSVESGACMVVSQVADQAIDLPDAKVAIVVSCITGSRGQEMQRVGRIQRPQKPGQEHELAEFHSLATGETHEDEFAARRRDWMVSEGYQHVDRVWWDADAIQRLPAGAKQLSASKIAKQVSQEMGRRAGATAYIDEDDDDDADDHAGEEVRVEVLVGGPGHDDTGEGHSSPCVWTA